MTAPWFHPDRLVLLKMIAVGITLFFIAVLFTQISVEDIVRTLGRVSLPGLVAGFFLYAGCYLFRAVRFSYLFNRELPVRDLFFVVCVHNLVNMALPAKTGELSYVYLVNRDHGRTIGEGLATLLIARIFDVITIASLFLLSFVLGMHAITAEPGFVFWVALVLGLFILLLVLFLYRSRSFLDAGERLCSTAGIGTTRVVTFILQKGEETVAALEMARTGRQYSFITIFLLSLGVWGSLYAFTALVVMDMGIRAGLFAIVFACTFAFMTAVLPVQGIGNFGTFEAGWTLGFLSIGVPPELAVSTGFGFHIINVVFNGILGLSGLVLLRGRIPRLTNPAG